MEFVKFIFRCILTAIGYMVGDVYHSASHATMGAIGAIGGLIFMASILFSLKFFGLNPDGCWKRKRGALYTTIISIATTMAYFLVAFLVVA